MVRGGWVNVKADPDLTWERALIDGKWFDLSLRFRLTAGQVLASSALFARFDPTV